MPASLSHPGVYVNEVPQTAQPIVGVSTSTAAFIGWVPETDIKYTPVLDRKVLRHARFTATLPPPDGSQTWTGTLSLQYALSKTPAVTAPSGGLNDIYWIIGFLNKLQIQFGPYITPQFETAQKTYGPYTIGSHEITFTPAQFYGPYKFGPYYLNSTELYHGALKSSDFPITLLDKTYRGWNVKIELLASLANVETPPSSSLSVGLQVSVTPPASEDTAQDAAPASNAPPSDAAAKPALPPIVGEIKQWIADHPQISAFIEKLIDKAVSTAEAVLKSLLEGIKINVVGPIAGIDVLYYQDKPPQLLPPPNEVILCTSYDDYRSRFYGTDIPKSGLFELSNAVYGFFDNGGSVCYVVRVANPGAVPDALTALEPFDDVSIVAAPMPSDLGQPNNQQMRSQIRQWLTEYCQRMGNRFAILDGEQDPSNPTRKDIYPNIDGTDHGPDSEYAAIYYPWILVGSQAVAVPPSGHIAGIYARTDFTRGVFKAPANVSVLGAVGLTADISKNQQDGLNPSGINCIRRLNGTNTVWGARTVGGDANGNYKYISSRRTMIYIEQSIREGTHWAVFEPNSAPLWAKLTRSISDFLYGLWRQGGLFGTTPQEAYFVRCDASTNPASARELGQVHALVGVALIQPAEFVVFDLYQFTA
jgi:phage tail sheath protein FI